MIPRIAHFVFGLREQHEPFHFLHAVAIESAQRFLRPEQIHFHYKNLPWGPHFDRVLPLLTLHEIDLVPEVLEADYEADVVPQWFRYAHHADFVRLDALIEHGGVYADIDTVFVREFPDDLFDAPFVIGHEGDVRDARTGEIRPSLCNALMLSAPGSEFARRWRDEMANWLDGSWSSHSGFLAERLSREMPEGIRIEPKETFFPFSYDRKGLAALLERDEPLPEAALSIHLWAHLWWDRERRDFSDVHGGRLTAPQLANAHTTLARLVRPFLPDQPAPRPELGRWVYAALDEQSGYGNSGTFRREALESAGVDVEWAPLHPVSGGPSYYGPAPALGTRKPPDVVVAHLVPEYLPAVRDRWPDAYLVAQTVWETDRCPAHWRECLDTADLVVSQSRFSAEVLADATTTPVVVVPPVLGEPTPAVLDPWSWIPEGTTVFYTIAEWNVRKAVDRTIEAFLRAFRADDPVILVVKTSQWDRTVPPPGPDDPPEAGSTAWALAGIMAGRPDCPSIALDNRPLPEIYLDALHRRGDCFVSLARGEGWGMGAFAAAMAGNPVVTTAYGGHLDFLDGSPGLVAYRPARVHDPMAPSYASDQHWAEPDVDHAAQLLRAVVTDPEPRRWAEEHAKLIRSRYRPDRVAEQFIEAVETGRRRGRDRSMALPTGLRWLATGPGSGFGDAAEAAMGGVRRAGVPVTWSPIGFGQTSWGTHYGPLLDPGGEDSSQADVVHADIEHDTVILCGSPVWNEALERETEGRRRVAMTTWETDRLPDDYVSALNRFDLVVVPSRFNLEVFRASGVATTLVALPHISRPVPAGPTPAPDGIVRFYTLGTWTTRKAMAETVLAFADAFSPADPVSLTVCSTEEDHIALDRIARRGWAVHPDEGRTWFTMEQLLADRTPAPVELRTRLTAAQVDELHRSHHVFLSLTRGEGWGLGPFDAAAWGNPVVTTGWGGVLDYLPVDSPYLVDYDLVPQTGDEPDNWSPQSPGHWARARAGHAVSVLRSVVDDREAAWALAARLAPEIRTRFAAPAMTERLLRALARVPSRERRHRPTPGPRRSRAG